MALKTEFLERHEDGVVFYRKYSDIGLSVRQVETGIIYGEVAVTDTDPYTYEEYDNGTGEEITSEEFMQMVEEAL